MPYVNRPYVRRDRQGASKNSAITTCASLSLSFSLSLSLSLSAHVFIKGVRTRAAQEGQRNRLTSQDLHFCPTSPDFGRCHHWLASTLPEIEVEPLDKHQIQFGCCASRTGDEKCKSVPIANPLKRERERELERSRQRRRRSLIRRSCFLSCSRTTTSPPPPLLVRRRRPTCIH